MTEQGDTVDIDCELLRELLGAAQRVVNGHRGEEEQELYALGALQGTAEVCLAVSGSTGDEAFQSLAHHAETLVSQVSSRLTVLEK